MERWKPLIAFLFVSVVAWGSSFFWIKIANRTLDAFSIVAWRMLFAVVSSWLYILVRRIRLPQLRRQWNVLLILGVGNIALPFALSTWGTTQIDSALAAILNATIPLFTALIAVFALKQEPVSKAQVVGILVGFAGTLLIISRNIDGGLSGSLLGQLAMLLASLMYAASTVLTQRELRGMHPMIIAAATTSVAALLLWTLLPLTGRLQIPSGASAWLAVSWLGLVGTTLALLLFYYVLEEWGATRSSLITYIIPLSAVALGVLVLNERLSWHVWVGGTVTISGILIVNWSKLSAARPLHPPAAAD